jgi:hypothetical protein
MFVDFSPDRFWDEPVSCKSCRGPILSSHATEQLQMPFDREHGLHELNGVYHSECAQPYLSVIRALALLTHAPL